MVRQKQEKEQLEFLTHYGFYVFCAVYLFFFAFMYKLANPYKEYLLQAGIFAQFIIITVMITAINLLLHALPHLFPAAKSQNVLSMLQIFAIICILITFITINGLPLDWFRLAGQGKIKNFSHFDKKHLAKARFLCYDTTIKISDYGLFLSYTFC